MAAASKLSKLILERDKMLGLLKHIGPFVDGSIYRFARTCGNPRCKCSQGEKHVSPYLSFKLPVTHPGKKPKSKTIYIPVDLEKEVTQWVQENAKLKHLAKEISTLNKQIIQTFVTVKGRHRKPS